MVSPLAVTNISVSDGVIVISLVPSFKEPSFATAFTKAVPIPVASNNPVLLIVAGPLTTIQDTVLFVAVPGRTFTSNCNVCPFTKVSSPITVMALTLFSFHLAYKVIPFEGIVSLLKSHDLINALSLYHPANV